MVCTCLKEITHAPITRQKLGSPNPSFFSSAYCVLQLGVSCCLCLVLSIRTLWHATSERPLGVRSLECYSHASHETADSGKSTHHVSAPAQRLIKFSRQEINGDFYRSSPYRGAGDDVDKAWDDLWMSRLKLRINHVKRIMC